MKGWGGTADAGLKSGPRWVAKGAREQRRWAKGASEVWEGDKEMLTRGAVNGEARHRAREGKGRGKGIRK